MQLVNTIIQGILLGGLYALYGTGLSLIFGVMRVVNLAHGDFIVAAAFLALALVQWFGLSPFVALLLVMPAFFILGMLIQQGIINRTLGKGIMPPLLITFGLSVILQNILQLIFTADSQGLDAGAIETASLPIGRLAVGIMPVITFGVAILVLVGLQLFLSKTQLGRAFRATSDNPEIAGLMGINSRRVYGVAMGISLMIVAVAGVLLGIRTNFAPAEGPARLIFAFEAVIIGGLGNIWGTLAGGIILGVAQNVGAFIDPTWFQLFGHIITLLVLALKPTGLFARTRDA